MSRKAHREPKPAERSKPGFFKKPGFFSFVAGLFWEPDLPRREDTPMTDRLRFMPLSVSLLIASPLFAEPLPGTQPLTVEGDLAAQMVAGIDRYLDRELAASARRTGRRSGSLTSPRRAYAKSVEPNRERLRNILGVVDQRLP